MKPEDQTNYEPDKRSGVQSRTVRKLTKALNVHPREILLEGGE